MLVNLREILKDTRKNHYAVGLFNCVSQDMARGVLAAAEELSSPVVLGSAERLLPGASLDDLYDMLHGMAARARARGTALRPRLSPGDCAQGGGSRLYFRNVRLQQTPV